MSKSIKFGLNLFFFSFLCFFSGCSQHDSKEKHEDKKLYLFVVQSHTGSIDAKGDDYYLTMQNVNPKVIYFSDRPERVSGFIRIEQFLKMWSEGENNFSQTPPNVGFSAVLTDMEADREVMRTLELENPKYSPQQDRLMFRIKTLQPPEPIRTGSIEFVTLFVDRAVEEKEFMK